MYSCKCVCVESNVCYGWCFGFWDLSTGRPYDTRSGTYEHYAGARSTESAGLALFALDGQVFPTQPQPRAQSPESQPARKKTRQWEEPVFTISVTTHTHTCTTANQPFLLPLCWVAQEVELVSTLHGFQLHKRLSIFYRLHSEKEKRKRAQSPTSYVSNSDLSMFCSCHFGSIFFF